MNPKVQENFSLTDHGEKIRGSPFLQAPFWDQLQISYWSITLVLVLLWAGVKRSKIKQLPEWLTLSTRMGLVQSDFGHGIWPQCQVLFHCLQLIQLQVSSRKKFTLENQAWPTVDKQCCIMLCSQCPGKGRSLWEDLDVFVLDNSIWLRTLWGLFYFSVKTPSTSSPTDTEVRFSNKK